MILFPAPSINNKDNNVQFGLWTPFFEHFLKWSVDVVNVKCLVILSQFCSFVVKVLYINNFKITNIITKIHVIKYQKMIGTYWDIYS